MNVRGRARALYNKEKLMKDLKTLVMTLGARYLEFRNATSIEINWLKGYQAEHRQRRESLEQLARNPTVTHRYQLEYSQRAYHSFKPDIDDAPDGFIAGIPVTEIDTVIEIGGGAAYIAMRLVRPDVAAYCVDLVLHPRLDSSDVPVAFIAGDITTHRTKRTCQSLASLRYRQWMATQPLYGHGGAPPYRIKETPELETKTLVVLSYCLDRVSDQRLTIKNFAAIVRARPNKQAVGLITVCLPGKPMSDGGGPVRYDGGAWITRGNNALEDYSLIVEACRSEGLTFTAGGLTTHYGTSLVDGYEELSCYVMVFRP